LLKVSLGILVISLLLFGSAGTFSYWNAWLFLALLFVPMFIAGLIMMRTNPSLLKKRLNIHEKQGEQQQVVKLSGFLFLAAFTVSGLNFRFQWLFFPNWIVLVGSLLFVISYGFYGEVLRENAFLSRTIEIQENQKVIDTGLYGLVRHPMYTFTTFMFLSIPLILNSPFSFLIILFYLLIIGKRMKYEEALLEEELVGYKEYKEKVKYKLIPFVW
ncbi:MAG: isoprenylcysteine carboxylmethyltransferase family protein, partial [Allobaculum sp.]|nr:isoprenylcysteine carboxylmethyltransferase family protein [Allobaculum sp.]